MAVDRRDVLRGIGGLAGIAAVRTVEARAPLPPTFVQAGFGDAV